MDVIQNQVSELQTNLTQKIDEVNILRHISIELNATLNLEETYRIIMQTMDELFEFNHSLILLLDKTGISMQVVASSGYEGDALGGEVAVGTGVIGMVAKKRRLMRMGNLGQQRKYASTIRRQMEQVGRTEELGKIIPIPGLPDAESQIAIPLMIRDKLIGVFSVESKEQRNFSDNDEVLVTIVANQAASGIQNAMLFSAEKERRKELDIALEQLQELNETLEHRVKDRTRELESAYKDLKHTQSELVQSEKMAIIGKLTAGIAHEINSPLSAIRSNSDIASRCIEKIEEIVRNDDSSLSAGEYEKFLKILKDTTVVSATAGKRIIKLVDSLRNFTRLDEAEFKRVNLHEGLDSTLTLIQHEMGPGVEVVKNYGTIPEINCYSGELNQVFMTMIRNAAQAITGDGEVKISTSFADKRVKIAISDTGKGLSPSELKGIFDFGLHAKDTRVRMSMGLINSYNIIQKHKGEIKVASEVGKGTTFTIYLPSDLNNAN